MIENIVAVCFSFALFVNAFLFVPQIVKLWSTKDIKGLSLWTFGGFTLIQMLAVLHGYFKHDYVLMIGFALSLLTCGTVTGLLIFYKLNDSN